MNVGHFYFLKPDYFNNFPSSDFMGNHSEVDAQSHNRPYFYAFTENDNIYWLIPISSKVAKFERVYRSKVDKYGKCDTIDFCEILGHRKAVLIQNMLPITKEYILNEYLDTDNHAVQISDKTRKRIISRAKKILALQRRGYELIFGDVLEIEKHLLAHS